MKRIFTSAIVILSLLAAFCFPASASDHISATLSGEFVHPGEETIITLYLEETTVSSLGVQVNGDDFTVVSAKWIPSGLMASFDMSKNKGVFSPGGATAMKGALFTVTVVANAPVGSCPVISLTIIGKNGTQTVFEETLRFCIEVRCPGHQFGEFIPGPDTHSKTCTICGEVSEYNHNWGEGVVTVDPSENAPGEMTYTCLDCGQKRTDVLPQLQPTPTEPAPTEPAPTEPVPTEPAPTEPVPTEPAPTEPTPTEPAPTEPAPTEPAPIEPVPTEPAPTEPTPTEPAPTEPVPTEPAPTEPVPTESVPNESLESKAQPPMTGSSILIAVIALCIVGGAAIFGILAWKRKTR